MEDAGEQGDEAVPGDLDADAEQDEGNDALDSVGGGGGDVLGEAGCVGVAEVDREAEHEDGDEQAGVGEQVVWRWAAAGCARRG